MGHKSLETTMRENNRKPPSSEGRLRNAQKTRQELSVSLVALLAVRDEEQTQMTGTSLAAVKQIDAHYRVRPTLPAGCLQARIDIHWTRYIFYAGFQVG
jgi:hypothetical protein